MRAGFDLQFRDAARMFGGDGGRRRGGRNWVGEGGEGGEGGGKGEKEGRWVRLSGVLLLEMFRQWIYPAVRVPP